MKETKDCWQIQKLEEELDLILFDRKSHPITPTDSGRAVIDQARVIIYNVAQLRELTRSEKEQESGIVRIGVLEINSVNARSVF